MPAKSKAQRKFMAMVLKCKETGECMSSKVKEASKKISKKADRDFAATKEKNLPEKKSFKEWIEENHPEA